MTSSHPTPAPCQWFVRLATALDRQSAPRLARLFLGAVLARGRRTVTTWIHTTRARPRPAGVVNDVAPVSPGAVPADSHASVRGTCAAGRHRWMDALRGRESSQKYLP